MRDVKEIGADESGWKKRGVKWGGGVSRRGEAHTLQGKVKGRKKGRVCEIGKKLMVVGNLLLLLS